MEKTFDTPNPVLVVVHNEVGQVDLTSGDSLTTRVSLEANSPGAEELVARAVVECQTSGGRDVVLVKIPNLHGMKFVRRNAVTVRIDMPLGSDLEVTTASADVDCRGSFGLVAIKTASGDVSADDARGDVRVKTASGDISIDSVGGELTMHSASGDLRCIGVAGRTNATTTSGEIEIGSAGDRLEVRNTSGSVRIGDLAGDARIVAVSGDVRLLAAAAGKLYIRSVSGDVAVGIVQGVRLSVDVQTLSGAAHSEIPLNEFRPSTEGAAAVDLTVKTVSGDVTVERAVAALV